MAIHRRPLRLTVATWVLFAVVATLVIIIARGPAKFFESGAVQSGMSCTVRHCPPTDDEPIGNNPNGNALRDTAR